MNFFRDYLRIIFIVAMALMAARAMAQTQPGNLRVVDAGPKSITIAWTGAPQIGSYSISYFKAHSGPTINAGSTSGASFTIRRLAAKSRYTIFVDYDGGFMQVSARTGKNSKEEKVSVNPYVATCLLLPADVSIIGYERHTHCQRVDGPGVGIPELIARGIVDALDVWGSVETNVRVCFRNQGQLRFLDAATAPRAVSDLDAEAVDGMICGTIDRAGTVVLLEGPADAMATPGTKNRQLRTRTAPAVETTAVAEVLRCHLVTTAYLSLRAGPSVFYTRLDAMPLGAKLVATAKAGDWFLIEYDGQMGWSSGTYLTKSAGCDTIGESNRVFLTLGAEPAPAEVEAQEDLQEPAEPAATEPGRYELIDCRLTAGDIINLRAEPGTEHNIEAEIPFRAQLLALDRSGDWFKVEYQGSMGWVNIDYVFRRGVCG